MGYSLLLIALASGAIAQSTVSLLLPLPRLQNIKASVIAADSTATTYIFGCPAGEDPNDCLFAASRTVTQGPSTWLFTVTYGANDPSFSSIEVDAGECKLNTEVDAAECTVSRTSTLTGNAVVSTTVITTFALLKNQSPVTVTAGLDKLKVAPGSTATDASTTTPTSTGSTAPVVSTTTPASTGSTATVVSTTTPTSTGSSTQTTLAKDTSTGTQTASSTAKPISTNAAGIVNSQNGMLAGVAAIIGGAIML